MNKIFQITACPVPDGDEILLHVSGEDWRQCSKFLFDELPLLTSKPHWFILKIVELKNCSCSKIGNPDFVETEIIEP